MITTEGSEAHVVQALSSGARGHIRKPFTPDQVKEPGYSSISGEGMRSLNPTAAPQETHAQWIPLLELEACEVFEVMLNSKLTVPDSDAAPSAERPAVTSMVGSAGRLCGVLSLTCDHKSAAITTFEMLGVDPENAGPQLSDAMGEIANMVAETSKTKPAWGMAVCFPRRQLSQATITTCTHLPILLASNYAFCLKTGP